jgi:hypothetical protein
VPVPAVESEPEATVVELLEDVAAPWGRNETATTTAKMAMTAITAPMRRERVRRFFRLRRSY